MMARMRAIAEQCASQAPAPGSAARFTFPVAPGPAGHHAPAADHGESRPRDRPRGPRHQDRRRVRWQPRVSRGADDRRPGAAGQWGPQRGGIIARPLAAGALQDGRAVLDRWAADFPSPDPAMGRSEIGFRPDASAIWRVSSLLGRARRAGAVRAAFLQDFARRAEDVGFDGVSGVRPPLRAPPSSGSFSWSPLTSLALVVGATRRVTSARGLLILPLRDPVVTAKAIANLDAVSGGRIVLESAWGADDKEFRACQVPKETRGRRTDEIARDHQRPVDAGFLCVRGPLLTIPESGWSPGRVQKPRPPILVAGGLVPSGTSRHITTSKGYTAHRSLQRAATLGDGLMTAYRSSPARHVAARRELDVVCAEARRSAAIHGPSASRTRTTCTSTWRPRRSGWPASWRASATTGTRTPPAST